jgi:competence protein ComEA
MRRVAGAAILFILLGARHLSAPPDDARVPATVPSAPAVAPVSSAPVAASGLPGDFHHHPLAFLSRAPADSLELLPGIGPVLAARIVADRTARGPYTAWTELDRVRGIGPVTVRRLNAASTRS